MKRTVRQAALKTLLASLLIVASVNVARWFSPAFFSPLIELYVWPVAAISAVVFIMTAGND